MRITYENYCRACNTVVVTDVPNHVCPECGEWMAHSAFLTCLHCKSKIYIDHFTNICDCGAMYNAFGQELAPVEQWDMEDREALHI